MQLEYTIYRLQNRGRATRDNYYPCKVQESKIRERRLSHSIEAKWVEIQIHTSYSYNWYKERCQQNLSLNETLSEINSKCWKHQSIVFTQFKIAIGTLLWHPLPSHHRWGTKSFVSRGPPLKFWNRTKELILEEKFDKTAPVAKS